MELFRLLGTIAINNGEAMQAMDDTVEKGSATQSKLSTAFGKIGSAAKTAGKVVGAGMLAASVAIIGLGKSALSSYADCEQLVGGVETLFGAGGKTIKEYAESVGKTVEEVKWEYSDLMIAQANVLSNADKAYKTAGMSANEYMETVTSFSAALISSLDGDTRAAASKADQAIVDMADNANKMGSSIESIQNAYQGFAKQNYTMLDNLKLGYGGTKEEMQRLLADAEAISGVEYDISSYADVVDAIHVIQTEMGVTGTTAKEASSTISGSIASMKASWKNLLTGLGDEDADLSGLTDQFVDSISTVADNVLPRTEVILGGMVTVIEKLIPKITEKLPSLLQTVLPSLVRGATALTSGLIKALPSILQMVIEQLPFIVSEIGAALIETLPVLYDTAKQMLSQLWGYISEAISSNDELNGVFTNVVAGIQDTWENHLKPTFEAIGAFLNDVVKPAFEFVWGEIIKPLVADTFSVIADLWETTLKPAFDGMCDFLTGVFTGDWGMAMSGIEQTTQAIFDGIGVLFEKWKERTTENFSLLWSNIQKIFSPVAEWFESKFSDAWQKVKDVFSTGGQIFDGIKEGIAGTFITVVNGLISGINKVVSVPFKAINKALSGIRNIEILGMTPFDWIESFDVPEMPKIGEAEFYAKGAVMTKPTIFGFNPASQKAMIGGEAGAEAIAPITTLKAYIAEAVASQNHAMMAELANIMMNHANILVGAIAQLQESGTIKVDDPYKIFKLVRDEYEKIDISTGGVG